MFLVEKNLLLLISIPTYSTYKVVFFNSKLSTSSHESHNMKQKLKGKQYLDFLQGPNTKRTFQKSSMVKFSTDIGVALFIKFFSVGGLKSQMPVFQVEFLLICTQEFCDVLQFDFYTSYLYFSKEDLSKLFVLLTYKYTLFYF